MIVASFHLQGHKFDFSQGEASVSMSLVRVSICESGEG